MRCTDMPKMADGYADRPLLCSSLGANHYSVINSDGNLLIYKRTGKTSLLQNTIPGQFGIICDFQPFPTDQHTALYSTNKGTIEILDIIKEGPYSRLQLVKQTIVYDSELFYSLLSTDALSDIDEISRIPISIREDGQHVAIGNDEGMLYVVSLSESDDSNSRTPNTNLTVKINAHDSKILSVAYSTNIKDDEPYLLATGSEDQLIHVLFAGKKNETSIKYSHLYTIDGNHASIESLCFGYNGTKMITASNDNCLMFRDLTPENGHSAKIIKVVQLDDDAVPFLCTDPKGKVLTACSNDKMILYNAENGQELRNYKTGEGTIFRIAVSPSGLHIAVCLLTETKSCIQLYDFFTGEKIEEIVNFDGFITNLSFSSNGKYLFYSTAESLFIYSISNADKIEPVKVERIDELIKEGSENVEPVFHELPGWALSKPANAQLPSWASENVSLNAPRGAWKSRIQKDDHQAKHAFVPKIIDPQETPRKLPPPLDEPGAKRPRISLTPRTAKDISIVYQNALNYSRKLLKDEEDKKQILNDLQDAREALDALIKEYGGECIAGEKIFVEAIQKYKALTKKNQ